MRLFEATLNEVFQMISHFSPFLFILIMVLFVSRESAMAFTISSPKLTTNQVDLSGDGVVDARDLFLFADYWLNRTNPTPTPTSPPQSNLWHDGIIGTIATGSLISLTTGDDGFYKMGRPHAYTDQGDGTITDANTGLMWIQDETVAGIIGTASWTVAKQNCEDLEYAGFTDWRMPTIEELSTLRDAGRNNPAINPLFTSQSSYYWSSTAYINNSTDFAWIVNFWTGNVLWEWKTSAWYMRPVRSGATAKTLRFTDHGNGTITDNNTGLMWVKDPSVTGIGKDSTWPEAISACESLTYASYSDWRVPNINELSSLIDYSRSAPAIDPIFLNTSSFSWSSTVVDGIGGHAWDVDFGVGIVAYSKQNTTGFLRPVRLPSQSVTSNQ